MEYLRSSAVWAVSYNPITLTLTVWFTDGAHPYDYFGVPASIYQGLISAGSVGCYFNQHIRGRYAA